MSFSVKPALKSFENEIYNIISNIGSGSVRNDFYDNRKEDENQICYYKNLFVFADNSKSTYKMWGTSYERVLRNSINNNYNEVEDDVKHKIGKETKKII